MPRKQASPDVEANAPLLPGWKFLEHVTPRRPARTIRKDGQPAKSRGRVTWAITYQDPHHSPDHVPVTVSTGKTRQVDALEEAKKINGDISDLLRDISAKKVVPRYLQLAHVQHAPGGVRKLIQEVVNEAASKLHNDHSARASQDFGDHFVRYCKNLGVLYMDQITRELMEGWLRTLILEPSKTNESGEAKWFSTIDLATRVVKATLRQGMKWAPGLNSDILQDALPTFTNKKGGQAALLRVLIEPTEKDRAWIMSRVWGRRPSGGDQDDGGRALSQDTFRTLFHAALRDDCRQLRKLLRSKRTLQDVEACKLAAVDITALYLYGLRLFEYTTLTRAGVILNRKEAMDHRTRTDFLKIIGKGRREREAGLTGYTQIGRALARAQVYKRGADEFVSEYPYQALQKKLFPRLIRITWTARHRDPITGVWDEDERHGPDCVAKDLRSSGCNFAQRLHHIPLETRAKRWGHTPDVHMANYLALTGAALNPAATLEEASDCVHLMQRAVRLLEIRNAIGIAPRLQARTAGEKLRKQQHPHKKPRPKVKTA